MERSSPPDSFELSDYTAVLRRGWWVIALTALVGLAAGTAYALLAPKKYTSMAAVYVSAPSTGSAQVANGRTNGVVDLDTEAQIVQSVTVANVAKGMLNSPQSATELSKAVNVTVPANTQVLQINCTQRNAVAAAHCAHAFAAAYLQNRANVTANTIKQQINGLQQQISALQTKITKLSASTKNMPRGTNERLNATTQLTLYNSQLSSLSNHVAALLAASVNTSGGNIISDASVQHSPSSPRRALDIPSGLAAGLLAGLIIAFWRDRRDKSIRGARDVEAMDLPVLLDNADGKKRSRLALIEPRSRLGQAFIELAHSLVTTLGQGNHVVFVVSAADGYAGSLAAANLATSIAAISSDDVALVSADPRSSAVAHLFGITETAGLAEVVLDRATVGEVERLPSDVPRLRVITPGACADAADYRLEHDTIERLVKRLHAVARYVIFEAPPGAYGADAYALAGVSDAAVVAVEIGRTLRDEVRECVKRLDRMGAAVLGAVLLQPLDKAPKSAMARTVAATPPRREAARPAIADSESEPKQQAEQQGRLVWPARNSDEREPWAARSTGGPQDAAAPGWLRAERDAADGRHGGPLRPVTGSDRATADGPQDTIAHG